MKIAVEVAEALAAGQPVVALESTIITHGLPRPRNLEIARQVGGGGARRRRACRPPIAMVAGEARVGLDDDALAAVAERDDVLKCGVRDLAPARGARRRGAAPPWRPPRIWRREPASACSPPAGSAACTAGRARAGTSRPT